MRTLYFARDKADKRPVNEQCQEMVEYQKERGFDTWGLIVQNNYLVLYGKDIEDVTKS